MPCNHKMVTLWLHGAPRWGALLRNIIQHYNLNLHVSNTPTHIRTNRNAHDSIIHFSISKNFPYLITTTLLNKLSSGHLPTCPKVDLIKSFSPPPSVTIDWVKFNHLANLDINFPEINPTTDIDNGINFVNSKITDAQIMLLHHNS